MAHRQHSGGRYLRRVELNEGKKYYLRNISWVGNTVYTTDYLAVLVRKKGGKWRMCVDNIGLNKACPKVPYPLPCIDQIVDSTAGCETLSFLDAYSGYHQIRMKESDQLATSFITPFGMYCYITMPFGLRNVGATYQRCMNQIGRAHV